MYKSKETAHVMSEIRKRLKENPNSTIPKIITDIRTDSENILYAISTVKSLSGAELSEELTNRNVDIILACLLAEKKLPKK